MHRITDPIEKIIADALDGAGIRYVIGRATGEADFGCPDLGVVIECKQFYSARAVEQMARHPNAILIQGRAAAKAFARMIG